jgi:hypothetical protein
VKVLTAAAGEDALLLLTTLSGAAQEFNRTLDIRLRFLDIGIDLIPVRPLHGQRGAPAEIWVGRLGRMIARERPQIIVALAGDAAAEAAVREGGKNGVRTVIFVPQDARDASTELREWGPSARLHDIADLAEPDEGRRLIEILVAERART